MSLLPVPAEVLKYAREQARMSQTAVAHGMGTVASVISKLEKGEDADPELARRYLQGVGTDLAAAVIEFYSRAWRSEPPSYLHPDREVLWLIDSTLSRLKDFEASDNYRPILHGPIDLSRLELETAAQYLRRRDHTIAWLGDIGVGKTTALAHAIGLLVGDARGQRRPAFPVGSGRTTLCETAVKVAPTFGVSVDALDDSEVVRLTRDLVLSLVPGSPGGGIAAEVSRALRNMAEMRTRRALVGEDEFITHDPIIDMLTQGFTPDQAVDKMIAAMKLPDRKERQLVLPEGSLDGVNWLSGLVSKINNGQDGRFGIPRRITVLMPLETLAAEGQVLSVVDTRGIEGTTQRSDLTAHRDDPRTLVVFCSKFADAPGQSALRFLEEARDAGSDVVERQRASILVLARGQEALQLPGLEEPISSRAEGYAIRKQEVAAAFSKSKVDKPSVYFFDAHADDPAKLWRQLRAQIGDMRATFANRVTAAAEGVANLIENVNIFKTTEARRKIEQDADKLINLIREIPPSLRPAHLNLLDQIDKAHASSLAASIARGGEWENFQMDHILGVGVRVDANIRTVNHLLRIEHKLQELGTEHNELRDVVKSIEAIRMRIAEGKQEFLAASLTIGRDAFATLLSKQTDVFEKAKERWGGGPGYKNEVAGYWRQFFETGQHASTLTAIDSRLQKAWEQYVVGALRSRTRVTFEN